MRKPAPPPPRPDEPSALLAGLTPAQFMRRYWQRKPLLIRGALASPRLVSRARLFELARRSNVESRVVRKAGRRWRLAHGPFTAASLPALTERGWTLLVQGVDLHDQAAHALLRSFRFVPDARLDDVMISWASPGGGIGPHVDDYDVFLLQAQGKRRWRIGRAERPTFDPSQPLKILSRFSPEQEHVLGEGDMLYLPPRWAHEGVAVGSDCITCSIGFRAPNRGDLAVEIAERLLEAYEDDAIHRDTALRATTHPGEIPRALREFAAAAFARWADQPFGVARALGEALTEPKANVAFSAPAQPWSSRGAVALDRRTRMMYDSRHVFINGESLRASGADARLMRRLADERGLDAAAVRVASRAAKAALAGWYSRGWLRHS